MIMLLTNSLTEPFPIVPLTFFSIFAGWHNTEGGVSIIYIVEVRTLKDGQMTYTSRYARRIPILCT